MKPANAQGLRRLGLVIEALCLVGIVALRRANAPARTFLGIDQAQALVAGLAVGFLCWLIGTAMIYWPGRKPSD